VPAVIIADNRFNVRFHGKSGHLTDLLRSRLMMTCRPA
jgi:hypothetical protein